MSAELSSLQTLGIKWPVPPCQAHWPWLLRGVLLCDIFWTRAWHCDILGIWAFPERQGLRKYLWRMSRKEMMQGSNLMRQVKVVLTFLLPCYLSPGGRVSTLPLWRGPSLVAPLSSPLWIPEYTSSPSGSSNSMNGCSLVFWLFIFRFGHLEILYCFPLSSRGLLI